MISLEVPEMGLDGLLGILGGSRPQQKFLQGISWQFQRAGPLQGSGVGLQLEVFPMDSCKRYSSNSCPDCLLCQIAIQ